MTCASFLAIFIRFTEFYSVIVRKPEAHRIARMPPREHMPIRGTQAFGQSEDASGVRRINIRYSLRLGFLGNQPLRTRSRCLNTSPMLQNEEKEKIPRKIDT